MENGNPLNRDSKSTGNNRLEMLMFYLDNKDGSGNTPLYGINVFKVRELLTLPRLTKKPNSHPYAAGFANIRGKAIPVIDLRKYYGIEDSASCDGERQEILIVTEFGGSMQGFIVNEVDKIIQLEWKDIEPPPDVISHLSGSRNGETLTGISILSEQSMVLIIDVEQVISEVLGVGEGVIESTELKKTGNNKTVLFADDSKVARAQVRKMLQAMGYEYITAHNGKEALDVLESIADESRQRGDRIEDSITAVITDVEMPVMDGYLLTQSIKSDDRLKNIPVMMHSSLSAEETIRMGNNVGVDAYVTKLSPSEFSKALDGIVTES